MSVEQSIQTKISQALQPTHLQVMNESHMHNVPPGSESHFKLVIVSATFDKQPSVRRHQKIYQILSEEMQNGVHALSLKTFTPEEWAEQSPTIPASPQCLGGSKENS